MDKWLACLVAAAVGLPLLMFFGNLNFEVSKSEAVEHPTAAGAAAAAPENAIGANFGYTATPEIYLGYRLARYNIGNDEGLLPEAVVDYTASDSYDTLLPGIVYLGGSWKSNPDSLELVSGEGKVILKYTARAVNIVAGPGQQPSLLQVVLDGNFVNSTNSGSDVVNSVADVDEQRLYSLVYDDGYYTRVVEINAKGNGFKLYTFTFG